MVHFFIRVKTFLSDVNSPLRKSLGLAGVTGYFYGIVRLSRQKVKSEIKILQIPKVLDKKKLYFLLFYFFS